MITLQHVTKQYANGNAAPRDLDLRIEAGELTVLVGPSGCGKTTTLRLMNRLVEPTSGHVFVNGRDLAEADPVVLRRSIGYVIQQVGLFPHMTIGANVATVPRLLGWDKQRRRERADELLHLVGLDPEVYRDRYPTELSGGQQQRVGVARALGADPPVLLMDEPFGALDPITRSRLQDELLALQAGVRKTIVFVTHDIDEAVKLGDRIVLLADDGTLAQHASALELLEQPASEFVSSFIGRERSMLLLSVRGIDLDRVVPLNSADHGAGLARVPHRARARDALAAIVATSADRVIVVDDDDQPLGVLHIADVVH